MTITLSQMAKFSNGKKKNGSAGVIPVYGGNGIFDYTDSANSENCIIIGRVGAYCGSVHYEESNCWISDNAIRCEAKPGNDIRYLYYLLKGLKLDHRQIGTSQPLLTQGILNAIEVGSAPSFEKQACIAEFLRQFDEKITLNQKTNDYLAAMLIALQRQVVETNETAEFRADEVFAIHIGKTPPRKQHEWFSFDRADNVIWMSIKDMGNAGAYLIDSSEYLTRQAVEKFNIRKCQPGSILLSFKLTIGRVGIVANEMVTNEAIACFASDDQRKLAYLYPLLLTYDYASMGSTSSIATAVNSKMVKAMPLKMPGENALDDYFKQAKPILDLLLSSTREIAALEQLRDTLLPKLMSGEIDVSQIELLTPPNNHLSDALSR